MKLNNNGWGMMEFIIIAFAIIMVIFLVAGEIEGIKGVIS